ncbi:hypothetical protein FACS1894186_8140 [Alphaproteobacteria bacterium]|nr:hypothetical protein FACS1894186_8140 [Alphaproteobacteria bacterium]
MGLAPFGIDNQKMPLAFDPKIGEFIHEVPGLADTEDCNQIRRLYEGYFSANSYPFVPLERAKMDTAMLMYYANFAASVQGCLDRTIVNLAAYLKEQFSSVNLIISGGVALNCTANGKLDRSGLFKNIFAHPGSNDAGCCIGAALQAYASLGHFRDEPPERMPIAYYGKEYPEDRIKLSLINANYDVSEAAAPKVADLLAQNKIVAWYQGGCEFGPRALGHRSLLANPATRDMLYRMNGVKEREKWRPLSPVVLAERYREIFEDENPQNLASFMLKTVKIKDSWRRKIPALVHVDGTSRPQTLDPEQNAALHEILMAFYKLTGLPLLINTSFNGKGQPIIETPRQALEFLENTLNFRMAARLRREMPELGWLGETCSLLSMTIA